MVSRLAAVAGAVERHTNAVLGCVPEVQPPDSRAMGARPFGAWNDVVHGGRRFKANFNLRSVHVHDALRLGAGLAVATAAVDVFGLQHGFWVAFATLTVIKSNLRATGRSVGEAIAGTIVGFLFAFAIIAGIEPSTGWYLALLPVVVAAAIYANVAVSFLAGQAGFTLAIIVLFNLLGPAGWRIGLIRVEDVAVGALAGLGIGALAWPRGASATIGNAAADLLESASAHLAATSRALVGQAHPESQSSSRQRALDAAIRAESAFAQYLGEHPAPDGARHWAHWLSTGNRLWYAADLIARSDQRHAEPVAETIHSADRLEAAYLETAAWLRRSRTPLVAAARSTESGLARETLPAWLDDLAADANSEDSPHDL
jgi:uncharacterized membrane protein YccC